MITVVKISSSAEKDLRKIPAFIQVKLLKWARTVEIIGLSETKKVPGYHDEPLKGKRKGQRSIRLNKAYRAIYVLKNKKIEFVEIQEVNKHEY